MTRSSFPSPDAQAHQVFVGIDVSKRTLDLARSDTRECRQFSNDKAGFDQIITLLKALPVKRIVVEATGGLQKPLFHALSDAGLDVVSCVNPAQVRHFAKAMGILAKTDTLDAAVLVDFARTVHPRITPRPLPIQEELQALIVCRRQLILSKTQQDNRMGSTASKPALAALRAVVRTLYKQIKAVSRKIEKLIDSDDDFKNMDLLLQSVPGVGPAVSSTLMAELQEIGQTGRAQLGALVGVAPFNHDSGKMRGKRAIRGGRITVRNTLYMAALTAMTHNPLIKLFADRLKAKGKASKVVIVAAMRKLLALLNAMIRENKKWSELKVVIEHAKNTQTA